MSDEGHVGARKLERPSRLIRIEEVQYRTGLGRSTIYRSMATGRFPRSMQFGGYAVVWLEGEIECWIKGNWA